jgi:uncharacterized membrane protein
MTTASNLNRLPTRTIIGMALVSFAVYPWLPADVPIHWDRWGRPDTFLPKSIGAFVMPMFAIFIIDGIRFLDRLSPAGFEVRRFQDAWDATLTCLALFLAAVHVLMLGSALGAQLYMHRAIPCLVGLLVTAIGAYLPQFKRNWYRLAGPVWVAGGLCIALTGLVAANWPWLWLSVWVALIGATMKLSYDCRRG